MRKIISLCYIAALVFSCCKDTLQESPTISGRALIQNFTLEEVKSIGAQYGLDSLVSIEKNSLLLYFTREELDAYFQKEKETRDGMKEYELYFERTKDVRSFDDYLALVSSLPVMKKKLIERKGGEEAFQKWAKERQKVKWHIYRDQKGVLTWVYPENDPGRPQDERLDNKK